jgi:hypothetical protein
MYLTCQDHGSFSPARRVIALTVYLKFQLNAKNSAEGVEVTYNHLRKGVYMALETYPPYASDDYAVRVFDRMGISEVEGSKWLNAGFGPLLIEEYFKHGATLQAAVILRAVGIGTHSLKLATEIGMSPTELLSSIEAAISRKISETDVSDLSVKDELLNVSIDGQSDEFLKTLRICFPEYSTLISSVGSSDVDICEVIKYVRDSEDSSEVEERLLEGLSLEEISWELMIPSPKPRQIWQRVGASLEEASIRLSNNQRPIDFLDGSDEGLHLVARRPKHGILGSQFQKWLLMELPINRVPKQM